MMCLPHGKAGVATNQPGLRYVRTLAGPCLLKMPCATQAHVLVCPMRDSGLTQHPQVLTGEHGLFPGSQAQAAQHRLRFGHQATRH